MVQVSVSWGGEFESTEADIIQSLVVNAEGLVRVLHQLVNRQGSVVGLHNSVRHLGRGHDTECVHDPVRVLLSDLGDEESAHTRPSSSTKGVGQLEALKAVTALCLFPDHVQYGVYQLSALSVVTLGPVVTCTTLTWEEKEATIKRLSKSLGNLQTAII